MPAVTVDAHLDAMAHGRRAEVERLRGIIRGAAPELAESVKWNAPSYAAAEHLVTMRLQPGDRVELILHRGAKPSADAPPAVDDPHGLLTWPASDRAVLVVRDAARLEADAEEIARIVRDWVAVVG